MIWFAIGLLVGIAASMIYVSFKNAPEVHVHSIGHTVQLMYRHKIKIMEGESLKADISEN